MSVKSRIHTAAYNVQYCRELQFVLAEIQSLNNGCMVFHSCSSELRFMQFTWIFMKKLNAVSVNRCSVPVR